MAWKFVLKRKRDFLQNHLLYESMVQDFAKVFGTNYPNFLTVRKKDFFTHYIDDETERAVSEKILKKIETEPNFPETILKTAKQKFEELLDFCKKIGKTQNLDNQQLTGLVKEYFRLYKQPYPYNMATIVTEAMETDSSDYSKKAIDTMARLRHFGRGSFNDAQQLSEPLFLEISKRLGLSSEEVKFLTPKEIENSLIGSRKLDFKKIISCRQKCYFIHKNGRFELVENKSFEIKQAAANSCINELNGLGTFPAVCSGKVRIVKSKDDLAVLKEGEIVVATMLTLDVVTGNIRKAGAIITDEGGITSHVAIISREFHIPALMGTKFATKFLKDGDLVEVDTGKGIARKIK